MHAPPVLYDAHNHLQDSRLASCREDILSATRREGVAKMVVNGSCEEDWPAVLALAKKYPEVIPSFGYHPWHIKERTADWQRRLVHFLDQGPAAVGEIGLDRWLKDHDIQRQEEVFIWQWRLASERNLPVSIHCLQAWGRLLEILRAEPRPQCGWVLHSFGGPREMIDSLAEWGAYFSLPGYFAQERKQKQRDAFLQVPPDRLLLETDAPDQRLPDARNAYPLADPQSGQALNHPANLAAVYRFAAELYEEPLAELARRVARNFARVFGGIGTAASQG